MSAKWRILLVAVAVVTPLDQLSKWWVANNVSPYDPIIVIEGFFRITHARNPGGALGVAQGVPAFVFIGLMLVALVLIWSFFRRVDEEDRLSAVSLGLIVAGAFGNLVDRVRLGEVVDWIQFDLGLFVFPDFNLADTAIVCGVGLLLLDVLIQETEESVAGDPPPAAAAAEPEPGPGPSPPDDPDEER